MLKRLSFFIDMERCTGCKTCMVACLDKHNLKKGVFFRRVTEYVGGDWMCNNDGTFQQSVFAYYFSISCNHCEDPACVKACPTTAMHKDEWGIVSVDHDQCVGCRYCEWACPYSAPQFDAELGMMRKCDFCREYLLEKSLPACVAACPNRALKFGDYNELIAEFGDQVEIEPLPDQEMTHPNLVYRINKNACAIGSNAGWKSNPEEV